MEDTINVCPFDAQHGLDSMSDNTPNTAYQTRAINRRVIHEFAEG